MTCLGISETTYFLASNITIFLKADKEDNKLFSVHFTFLGVVYHNYYTNRKLLQEQKTIIVAMSLTLR